MNLHIRIATGSSQPIYRQIVNQVRIAVATGAVAPGDAIPSVRSLAEELVINRNTVAKAYAELTQAGVIESEPGRGMRISPQRHVFTKAERLRRVEPVLQAFIEEAICLGLSPDEVRDAVNKRLKAAKPNPTSGA